MSKDLDAFIAARYCMFSTTAEKFISETDLRTWMTGHVRVPVEVLTKGGINIAIIEPPEVKGRVMSEMFWRGVYAAQKAMLNESKGEGK